MSNRMTFKKTDRWYVQIHSISIIIANITSKRVISLKMNTTQQDCNVGINVCSLSWELQSIESKIVKLLYHEMTFQSLNASKYKTKTGQFCRHVKRWLETVRDYIANSKVERTMERIQVRASGKLEIKAINEVHWENVFIFTPHVYLKQYTVSGTPLIIQN